jgi:excisionase family DNA binding protein
MTRPASDTPPTARLRPDTTRNWEETLAAARHYLAQTTETVTPATAPAELLACLTQYRAHLAAIIAAYSPDAFPDHMRLAEVAEVFRVHIRTIIRWADTGKLSCFRTAGGHRRFRTADVRALLTSAGQPPHQLAPLTPARTTSRPRTVTAHMPHNGRPAGVRDLCAPDGAPSGRLPAQTRL